MTAPLALALRSQVAVRLIVIKKHKARKQRHAKPSSKRRGCFFWTLLVTVVALIFGGRYAYQKYTSAKKAADSIYNSSNIKKRVM